MSSPFDIFRKNTKTLMVPLIGLSMFAFVVFGFSDPSTIGNMMPLVAALMLGAALWFLSGKSGWEGAAIGTVGAILGASIGIFMPYLNPGQVVASTNAGSLTFNEMDRLGRQRSLANAFLISAQRQAIEESGEEPRTRMQQFGEPTPDAMLNHFLLTKEAERLGIQVDDRAVLDFIKEATQNDLTSDGYRKALKATRAAESEVFDALRSELRARWAAYVLSPSVSPTPGELWTLFKRANVRESLAIAELPAAAFRDDVPEPTEEELRQFFEQYRAARPGQLGPGEPGFRQDRKVQLVYLEADYLTALDQVEAPTEKEVKAFYEENKETLFRNPAFGREESDLLKDLTIPSLDGPAFDPFGTGGTGSGSDTVTAPPAEAGRPAEAEEQTGQDAAEESTETPESSEGAPSSSESDETDSGEADPSDAASGDGESGDGESPEADEEAGDAEESDAQSSLPLQSFNGFAFLQDDPDSAEPLEADTGEEPASADEGSDENTSDEESGDEKSDEEKGDESGSEMKIEPKDVPKFRELNEELREEIRKSLKRERAFEVLDEKIEAAEKQMKAITDNTFADVSIGELDAEDPDVKAAAKEAWDQAAREAVRKLREYATEQNLNFATTKLVTFRDLVESEEYPIGLAVDPQSQSDPFGRNLNNVATQVFQDRPDGGVRILITQVAEDPTEGSRFAFWKLDDRDAYVPDYDEEGIVEQVTEAWYAVKSSELARERAEAVAEAARESGKESLEEALATDSGPMTVTGDKEGEALTVRTTPPFTWLRQSTAPTFGLNLPVLEPSQVPGLEPVGPDFMDTVFEELGDGEIGSAPSLDRSTYYVVKVLDRSPNNAGDMEALRQEFMNENFFQFMSPYAGILRSERQNLMVRWQADLAEKYDVQWNEAARQQR
ncbi:hypothetical protein [Stratiformator vulcanicus]|uniref:Periplasmic folding chaperone n=1 Tax=Stratiformator vulcanicus TaxID=2527980 RepID=A0A517R3P3_9PLAN|nr:hypothetical protein [Stratiformator vulcanicus]QDT38515.1 hypothetical protein Pan189_29090 [Stratiformator vulcanicus]